MHQTRQRQHSPQAYSPEYSSPFSSKSLLQARFNQVSPQSRAAAAATAADKGGVTRYNMNAKENNFMEAPLPVFQEQTCCNGQMIPQVTVVGSDTGDGGKAILSDMSDEMLIKQLQLNMNEKFSSAAFQSSSNVLQEANTNSFMPPPNKTMMTNQHSPQKGSILNDIEGAGAGAIVTSKHNSCETHQIKMQERVSPKKMKKSSPAKKAKNSTSKFVQAKIQSHTWANTMKAMKATTVKGANMRQQAQLQKQQSSSSSQQRQSIRQKSSNISNENNAAHESSAPVPHPYPIVQQQPFPKDQEEVDDYGVTDTLNPRKYEYQAQTISDQVNCGIVVTDCESVQQYVDVLAPTTDRKIEKFMTWSSASPAITTPQISAPAFRTDFVHAFPYENVNNETIQEQPTEEQLQASAIMATGPPPQPANMADANMAAYSEYTPKTHQAPSQEPQVMLTAQEVLQLANSMQQHAAMESVSALEAVAHRMSGSGERSDSESLKQIRMINQLMQKKFTSNYSPDRCSLDASDSLKDFSMGTEPVAVGHVTHYNDQYPSATRHNEYESVPPTLQARLTNLSSDNTSMAAQKDSNTTCQNLRQQALPYVIHANLQQQAEDELESVNQGTTLLNVNDRSQVSVNDYKNGNGNNTNLKQFLKDHSQRQSQRPGSTRQPSSMHTSGKSSPKRSAIYGQCQQPLEELYKPILRNGCGQATGGNKQIVRSSVDSSNYLRPSQSTKGHISGTTTANVCPYTGEKTTPNKPNFVSPSTSAVAPAVLLKRSDSRHSVRRNLEPQLNAGQKQQSLSPRGTIRLDQQQKIIRTAAFGTMIHKYDTKPRHGMQSSRSKDATYSTGKSARLSIDNKYSISNLKQRTRNLKNDNITVSRSQVLSKDKQESASSKRDSAERQSYQFSKKNYNSEQSQASQSQQAHSRNGRVTTSKADYQQAQQTLTITPTTSKSPAPRTALMTLAAPISNRAALLDQAKSMALKQQHTPQLKASMYQLRRAVESMKSLEVQTFLEFERIKKPSAAVLAIARMTCIYFEAIRNRGPEQMDHVESMQSWQQIQEYMRLNLTSCVSELRNLLKQKIVQLGRLQEQDSTNAELQQKTQEIEAFLEKIWETFFIESKIRVIRRFMQTNKQMKGLVHLIYSFVCLALNLEREFNCDNLLGLTEQPSVKAEELKQILQIHQFTNLAPATEAPKEPITIEAEDLRPGSIENASYCSRCSCEQTQQQNKGQQQLRSSRKESCGSIERMRSSNHRSLAASQQMADQSQEECSGPSSEVVDVLIQNGRKEPVDMGQMNMFKTLDMVYVEQPSRRSVRSNKSNKGIASVERQRNHLLTQSSDDKQSNGMEKPVFISSGVMKIKGSKSMIKVVDDYEASFDDEANNEESYGPFVASHNINADLNNDIREQVFFEAAEQEAQRAAAEAEAEANEIVSKKQVATRSSGSKMAGYMAATQSSTLQKKTQVVTSRRRNRENRSASRGSDFVSVVRASMTSNSKDATATARNQRMTPTARVIQSQAQIQPQITSMTSRQKQPQFMHRFKSNGHRGGKDVSPATSRPLSKTASSRNVSQKKLNSNFSSNQQMHQQQTMQMPSTEAVTQPRHVRTTTLYKSTASHTAKMNKPTKSPLTRDSSVKSIQRQSFGQTAQLTSGASATKFSTANLLKVNTNNLSRKTKSQTNLKVMMSKRVSGATPKHQQTSINVTNQQSSHAKRYNQQPQDLDCATVEQIHHLQQVEARQAQQSGSVERNALMQMQIQYLNDHGTREAKRNLARQSLEVLKSGVSQVHADQFINEQVIYSSRRYSQVQVDEQERLEQNLQRKQEEAKGTAVYEPDQQQMDMMPSFGEIQANTEDIRRGSLAINEDSMCQVMTKRTMQAPPQEPSFTPEKAFQSYHHQLPIYRPEMIDGASILTREAVNYAQNREQSREIVSNCEQLLMNSIEKPSCTINDSVQNAERACFIMQKAQDITENINSCYKTHNMPQINMATIERLKMRRLQLKQDDDGADDNNMNGVEQQNQVQSTSLEVTPRRSQEYQRKPTQAASSTDQSCNVISTQTQIQTSQSLEGSTSDLQHQADMKKQISFAEALNNLKAEVEILMKSRMRTTLN